jgi:sigma-54 dependent transcriptional regulator, acetoin dehydrogenase operon transcriptional activator AcoR
MTTDATGLAKVRERFLTDEQVDEASVRDTILASWWRSRQWNVLADRVTHRFDDDPNLDTPLTRSALPVLTSLLGNLDGQPISVILTDADGVVLRRLSADGGLDRHLDRVHLAPGFCYAEQFVGTNGIGTALEGGRPMHVFGHEHYAENLEDLACAAVPIQHPITGKTVGAVDLTCWRRDAGALLIALAKTTSDQIRQALLMDGGEREYELLQAYLRACRRSTGIVIALNGDVVMLNDHAQLVLDPGDQAVILQQAGQSLADGHTDTVTLALPSGGTARMHCRAVGAQGNPAGGVVHVRIDASATDLTPLQRSAPRMPLPGVVGSGALWLRACHQIEAAHASGEWLVIEGEAGVGKTALAKAVHQRRSPGGRVHVIGNDQTAAAWAIETERELEGRSGLLVFEHIDRLSEAQLHLLTAAMRAAAEATTPLRVVATMGTSSPAQHLSGVLSQFPLTVRVPPLRHHSDDLHQLVPFILTRLQAHRVTCSPATMQLLVRSNWPGNIAQLVQVLREVVQHRRSGVIEPDDLPPECRTVSRRMLTPIEAMERDAIVSGLLDSKGNKVATANALGMSRATIYRKIHEYGIVSPPT